MNMKPGLLSRTSSLWIIILLVAFLSFSISFSANAKSSFSYNGSVEELRRYLLTADDANVFFGSDSTIYITEPLEFSGNSLKFKGAGARIVDLSGSGALRLNQVQSLELSDIEFVASPSRLLNCIDQDCSGISVSAKSGRDLKIALENVSVIGAAGHGVHVRANDSNVFLRSRDSSIHSAGWFLSDQDGIRVDQTGSGSIHWLDRNSSFVGNGGDGVELDETAAGGVKAVISGSVFEANGAYCFGRQDENGCVDMSEKSGFDLDDGFDIDETGDGNVTAVLKGVKVLSNFDEGVDFDELDSGFLSVEVQDSISLSWFDESLSFSGGGEASDNCLLLDVFTGPFDSPQDACRQID